MLIACRRFADRAKIFCKQGTDIHGEQHGNSESPVQNISRIRQTCICYLWHVPYLTIQTVLCGEYKADEHSLVSVKDWTGLVESSLRQFHSQWINTLMASPYYMVNHLTNAIKNITINPPFHTGTTIALISEVWHSYKHVNPITRLPILLLSRIFDPVGLNNYAILVLQVW